MTEYIPDPMTATEVEERWAQVGPSPMHPLLVMAIERVFDTMVRLGHLKPIPEKDKD